MDGQIPIDDVAICPACDGSGFGVADTMCGFCGGCGGVPIKVAEREIASRQRQTNSEFSK